LQTFSFSFGIPQRRVAEFLKSISISIIKLVSILLQSLKRPNFTARKTFDFVFGLKVNANLQASAG
jgi:hypothetical protein